MGIHGISQFRPPHPPGGPQKPGDPQPHLQGGPQRPGDPQPHLNGGMGGPQKPGDPQPHLYGGAGGPQKPGDPQPHLLGNNGQNGINDSNDQGPPPGAMGNPMDTMILGMMKLFGVQPSGDKNSDMQKLMEMMNGGNSNSGATAFSSLA